MAGVSEEPVKKPILLDTSPLIIMCSFKGGGRLVVEHIIPSQQLKIVETVASEATANPAHSDAAVVLRLFRTYASCILMAGERS